MIICIKKFSIHLTAHTQTNKRKAYIPLRNRKANKSNSQQIHKPNKKVTGTLMYVMAQIGRGLTGKIYQKIYLFCIRIHCIFHSHEYRREHLHPRYDKMGNSKNRSHGYYTRRRGNRPISLHCSGSKDDTTCPLRGKSSPSMPQALCVCFSALILTDFTCISMGSTVRWFKSTVDIYVYRTQFTDPTVGLKICKTPIIHPKTN